MLIYSAKIYKYFNVATKRPTFFEKRAYDTKKSEALASPLRGGRWTRTTERIPGQIYSLLQLPLCDSPKK